MPTVEQVRNKVLRMMAQSFQVKLNDDGDVIVRYESATCLVTVVDWQSNNEGRNTLVHVRIPILWNVSLTPELYKWVATEGQNYMIGTVRVKMVEGKTEGNLWFVQYLLGDNLDVNELENTVKFMLGDSNRLDDELQKKFGGKRTTDL